VRWSLGGWAFVAKRPWLYRLAARMGAMTMRLASGGRGRLKSFIGAGGWTRHRDLAAPREGTFMDQYARGRRR